MTSPAFFKLSRYYTQKGSNCFRLLLFWWRNSTAGKSFSMILIVCFKTDEPNIREWKSIKPRWKYSRFKKKKKKTQKKRDVVSHHFK